MDKLTQQTASIDANLKVLTKILEDPKGKKSKSVQISADFSMGTLRDTAWKTAQATGALAFMPYADAQRYADVYGLQQDCLSQQNKIPEDEAQFLGVLAKTNFDHGDVTPEQASAALERFGVWRAHLGYLTLMAKATALNDKALLEGKEGPRELHEGIGGSGK